MIRKKRKSSSRRSMSSPAKNHTGDKQEGSQDPKTKRKMKNSIRDFQMVRSVLLQIMINVSFLSCYFQCQLCQKIIRPAKPSYFRKHLQSAHTERGKMSKCQWPDCNYVRTLTIYTYNTLKLDFFENGPKKIIFDHFFWKVYFGNKKDK